MIPNLKTVVVHCFDPRVTGGIPAAVTKALPGQISLGEVFEFVGVGGKKKIGTNTTIFPVVVAGGRIPGTRKRVVKEKLLTWTRANRVIAGEPSPSV